MRYIDNGDGTITDMKTGLMWQKEAATDKTWQDALDYAKGLVLAGHSDWRVPSIKELTKLISYKHTYPASKFPKTESSYYWSSTTNASNSGYAWCVDFYNGYVYNYSKTDAYAVRAVRGGKEKGVRRRRRNNMERVSMWISDHKKAMKEEEKDEKIATLEAVNSRQEKEKEIAALKAANSRQEEENKRLREKIWIIQPFTDAGKIAQDALEEVKEWQNL